MVIKRIGLILLSSLVFCLLGTGILFASPSASYPFFDEFPSKAPPLNIINEAPGKLWFTSPMSNSVGLLIVTSTVDFKVQLFPVPTSNSEPYDLINYKGSIWFTEKKGNKLAKLDIATGSIQEFALPTASSEPTGIVAMSDGSIWLVERLGNRFVKFDPATSAFIEILYATANAHFEDLAVGPNGILWATAPNLDRVVSYEPIPNRFANHFTLPYGSPIQISVDPDNLPWITARSKSGTNVDAIGVFAPGTLALWKWFSTPPEQNGVAGLFRRRVGSTNELWYTGNLSGNAGRLSASLDKSSGAALSVDLPSSVNSKPWGVSVDGDNYVWVALQGTSRVVRWRPPYFYETFLPVIAR